MSDKKQVPSKKDKAMRKYLLAKAGELIAEAQKFSGMGDEVWTLVYLRSATSLIEAIRNL